MELHRNHDTQHSGALDTGGPIPISQGYERRRDRRHDLTTRGVRIERWDGFRKVGSPLGQLVDLSASGARIESDTADTYGLAPQSHIRVRLCLPDTAGISPFIQTGNEMTIQPANEWTGWMEVARLIPMSDGHVEVGGRLLDMEDLDRGMLKLYLSIHPLAA